MAGRMLKYSKGELKSFKLTHVLFTNISTNDNDDNRIRTLFERDLPMKIEAAHYLGLSAVSVYTNLYSFYKQPGIFNHYFAQQYCSAPLALGKLFKAYYFSSTFKANDYSIIILNNTKIPDRTHYILTKEGTSPLEGIDEAFNIFSSLIKPNGTVGIVCNTAHYFADSINNKAKLCGFSFINMPEFTLKYISLSNLSRRCCVLCTQGTKTAQIYNRANPGGLEILYPTDKQCEEVQSIIYQIKDTSNIDISKQLKLALNGVDYEILTPTKYEISNI